ncbi:Conserved oligomeric Golgi complex subunit 3 [Balamuthia mandrillaris]
MESNSWDIFLPLSERVVLDLSRESKPYVLRHRTRGRTPKLSWLDHILLLLLVYCLACTFDDLAGCFRLKQTTVEAAINRIRPILLEVLEDRWWQGNRCRPIPLMDKDETLSQYAHIALLVDSTSVEVFCPNNSRFEEGKHYFDGKNRIYALKKEVAVMASPPHFALFSFPGAPGARHDYSILKEHYSAYIPYLTKSAQETAMIHRVDGNETSWSALFDKGYVGPAQDTPGEDSSRTFSKQRASKASGAYRMLFWTNVQALGLSTQALSL